MKTNIYFEKCNFHLIPTIHLYYLVTEIFWEDLKHARRIYQKRAVLEDDGRGAVSVRRLGGPGVVQGVKEKVINPVMSPITRKLSDQNVKNVDNNVTKDGNIAAN